MGFKIWLAERLRKAGLHGPWLLARYGYLHERGWFRAYAEGRPVDASGAALPWLSYPFIDFLSARLRPEISVFEYGCGHSTRWFAERVQMLHSVEHDPVWHERMSRQLPPGADLRLETDLTRYPHAPADRSRAFDLILVDGMVREACLRLAPGFLTARGVVVLDNSDREEYAEGWAALAALGFRRVDFVGMAPASPITTATAVMYRDGNWLGL